MKLFSIAVSLGLSATAVGPPQAPPTEAVPKFTITTVAGTGTCGFSGDEGPAIEACIERPTAVAVDTNGVLYIADESNLRVRMVTPEDGLISTFIGTGDTGVQTDDRYAFETNLLSAYGIATDSENNLYVLSRGHAKVFKVGEDGIAQRIIGSGESGYSGDGGPAVDAQVNFPNHLVADGEGNLFLADSGNHCIRKVSPAGVITTVAGTGERGFGGDGGKAIEAQLSTPAAIAIDAAGNLYVADFGNHRIRKVSPDGIISSIAGNGTADYNGDGLPALECQIGEPCGVAVDAEGFVYIGDQINLRVRVVTPGGRMYTVAGTGVQGLTGDGGPAKQAQLSNPDIIAVDQKGNVFVPDHLNCAVRKLTRIRE